MGTGVATLSLSFVTGLDTTTNVGVRALQCSFRANTSAKYPMGRPKLSACRVLWFVQWTLVTTRCATANRRMRRT